MLGAAQGRGTNIPREEVRDRLRKAFSLATSRWPAKVVIKETTEILNKKCCDFSQLVNFLSSGSRLWGSHTASTPLLLDAFWESETARFLLEEWASLREEKEAELAGKTRVRIRGPIGSNTGAPANPAPQARPAARVEPEQEEHTEDCIVVRTSLDSGDESDL